MPDRASSVDPAVQAQLDRLWALSPGADVLGLERVTALLDRIGDPQLRLPPVFHVAGTNGKGSTCAFLRGALEAAGHQVHAYTSPHLVRFNERIRLAGRLIQDAALAGLLVEVLDAGGDIGASFFEVTTAAAFLAFARVPADACVIEVGLGGRLDATNVVRPLVTGIAQLGVDHQSFLGDTVEAIAAEKAGIAKPGVPLVTMAYQPSVTERVAAVARAAGAPVLAADTAWHWQADSTLTYRDDAGALTLPLPAMAGAHQPSNLALAIAMLRHQQRFAVPAAALARAARETRWPARMQRLRPGPLTALLPRDTQLWLDGGHNEAAARSIAASLAMLRQTSSGTELPIHLVLGMLANKDAAGLLAPIAPLVASVVAVPVAGHECHTPAALAAAAGRAGVAVTDTAPDIAAALSLVRPRLGTRKVSAIVLILGSLYLAGTVLNANGEPPV